MSSSPRCPDYSMPITLGEKVVDFSFDSFNPVSGKFEVRSINEYLFKGKWVILFFYPGDFTFV